jgi:hypothetical protein
LNDAPSAGFAGEDFDSKRPRSQRKQLASLPEAEWERWLPQLEWINLPLGQMLYEFGPSQTHVYFPATAIISLRKTYTTSWDINGLSATRR